ncbi:hypothetical protein BP5796_10825 [Coleophoma crateriformis]|uniref:Heterokaryon incompatibility domain-containing protein n=1 Tax=Coleophoma crateriformis TaxID=565419 RepID=A0A3D8QL28_9HELO|nr:hypothetical protein BP5796_10825 [Coleophoma crateriformis]
MDPFSMSHHETGWPLRLLHVSSMTSFERQEGNIYRGVTEPEYNCISYTWGRWMSEDRSIVIDGVNWPIPGVKQDCFSVQNFQQAIHRASQGVAFIWLDVACIDQKHRAVKMAEIGRQAAIFNGARNSFIWLHSAPFANLQPAVEGLARLSSMLEEEVRELCGYESPATESSMMSIAGEHDVQLSALCHNTEWLESVLKNLEVLSQEPWFSSLWTLQEMYLRPDGKILARDANTISIQSGSHGPITIANIIMYANTIRDQLVKTNRTQDEMEPSHESSIQRILVLIDQMGLAGSSFNNPCLLYSAAKHRTSFCSTDRIYGIMQVFGYKLGEAAFPLQSFSLLDLQIQLGAAFNKSSPVWAQLFVREKPSQLGKSWLVDEDAAFPDRLQFAETIPKSLCTIDVDSNGTCQFIGKSCMLEDMACFWRRSSAVTAVGESTELPAVQDILLDSVAEVSSISADLRNLSYKNPKQNDLASQLVSHFGDKIRILMVGMLLEGEGETLDARSEAEEQEEEGEVVGILVVKLGNGETKTWRRVGICLWASRMEDVCSTDNLWTEFTGIIQ